MKIERARAIILHNNKILMIQRLRSDSEYYVLPGGKLEEGELPETTVMREIKEETSLDTKFIKKLDSLTDKDGTVHHIYLCEYISGIPELTIDSPEVAEASDGNVYTPMWIDTRHIPTLQIWPAEVKPFLLNYLKI
jgi:ADP-ribose pyrophosphatase YjhB (NUDIX family)